MSAPRLAARAVAVLLLALAAGCRACAPRASGPLQLGYMGNVTHAQALVGRADGTFERHAGAGAVQLRLFNAGPASLEALLAGSLDMAYVGGGPAVVGHVRSQGTLHVLAGAASGGAVLVARTARTPAELLGARVAVPLLGNTQDLSLRTWLRAHGLRDVPLGGTGVQVLPLANADALAQMRRGELEAAWVPEPWGARMVHEAGAHVLVDERTLWPSGRFPTTVLVATDRALTRAPAAVRAVLAAHTELTRRWAARPAAFADAANRAYGALTGHPLPLTVRDEAFSRLEPTLDPLDEELEELARRLVQLGYLPRGASARGLVRPLD
ncbi:MAG: hypothetical protein RL653_2546 [Pseudomonadota bacterium]